MLELDKEVVSRIKTDATLISLMGITADDSRVYTWNTSVKISYSSTQPSSILYRDNLGGRDFNWSYPSQMPRLMYFFRVLSINQLNLGQVTECLIDLFDMTSIQSASWSVKWIELTGSSDGPNEGEPTFPLYVTNNSFNFKIFVKR